MPTDGNIGHDDDLRTLVGQRTRELVDMQTGEVIRVEQVTKTSPGSKQFWKVYLTEFAKVLKGFEGRQLAVALHVLMNTNQTSNLFFGTYSEIMREVEVSRQTVATTFGKLQRRRFLRKVKGGVWMVNPDVIMKGNDNKRHLLLRRFAELGD